MGDKGPQRARVGGGGGAGGGDVLWGRGGGGGDVLSGRGVGDVLSLQRSGGSLS